MIFNFKEERVKRILEIINDIQEKGLIEDYCIAGGVASMFYTEPIFTYDLDFFILLKPELMSRKIITISHISDYLKSLGYDWDGEFIIIEGIPIQFIVVNSELEKDALRNAKDTLYEGIKTRVLRAEYLIAIYSNVRREKDIEKIGRIIRQSKIDNRLLGNIFKKYNLHNPLDKKCGKHLR